MDWESSPSSTSWKFDVFLSFSPEDTRYHFTSHLYFDLLRNGVKALAQDDKKQEEYSSSKILKEIEKSRISIVVFSQNYAASTSRLEELAKIAECIDYSAEHKQTVFAVFYDLKPCEVRQQRKGIYEKVFGEYEERFKQNLQMVERWRKAITKVANLQYCWIVEKESHRTQVMYDSVRRALNKKSLKASVMDEPVIQLQLEAFKNLVHKGSDVHEERSHLNLALKLLPLGWLVDQKKNRVRTEVIYDIVRSAKNILGIKASNAMDELVGIQPRLEALQRLVDLDSNNDVIGVIGICGMRESGKTTLASLLYHRISHKFDAFCFLQDVTTVSAIPNGVCCLQQQILRQILQQENLKISDVQQGCSLIATRLRNLKILLVLDDVHHIQTLEVLVGNHDWFGVGSRIIITSRDENILKSCGVDQIFKVEQLSKKEASQRFKSFYLSRRQKEIFLDIACFFVGENINNVIEILSDCKFDPTHVIEALIRNSLITISDDEKIEMHYMLQELGKKIVQQEFPNEPGKRSRLWFDDDFLHVMETNTGNLNTKALVLNPKVPEERTLKVDALSKMCSLQFLIIRNVNFSGVLNDLSNSLRYVWWHRFPFTCLPSSFEAYNLVQLIMPHSNIRRLWEESKTLHYLRNLDLHGSKYLIQTPDFKRLPNLEKLNLEGCDIGLVVLDPSITFHKNLKSLNLRNCTSLVSVPNNLFGLTSLEILNLAGCSKFAECLDFDDDWMSATEGDEEVLSNQDLPLFQEIGCGINREHASSSTITADDEYPIARCIEGLDEVDDVSDDSYIKALEKFKDPYWRQVFLTMSQKRKKAWLNKLV